MVSSIDVKFIFDSVCLRLFSSTNILQIACRCRPSSCLFAACHVFGNYFAKFSLLKRVKCPPFLFSQPKQLNLVPRSSRLNVHELTRKLHFSRQRLINRKFFSKFQVMENYACAFSQSE